jgi:hypothetical protein
MHSEVISARRHAILLDSPFFVDTGRFAACESRETCASEPVGLAQSGTWSFGKRAVLARSARQELQSLARWSASDRAASGVTDQSLPMPLALGDLFLLGCSS